MWCPVKNLLNSLHRIYIQALSEHAYRGLSWQVPYDRPLTEKEKIQYGYIVKIGPGYPIPLPVDNDEPWKSEEEKVKYVPLQVKEGDLAVFLQGGAYEVMYQNEKYFIVPQSSILMIERDDSLFN